jgi:hypothetical protein
MATTVFNPAAFKADIYAGGADDTKATKRGLDYAQQVGWTPQQTATNWNDALGTDFGVADLWAAAKGQDVPNDRGQGGGSYLISALRGFSPTGPADAGLKFYENKTIPTGGGNGGMVPGAPVQSGTKNAPKMGDGSSTPNIFTPPVTQMPQATDAQFTNPDAFVNEIYAGGANDTEATKNGLLLAQDFGWSPVETANNWNTALGTEFGARDYYRAMEEAGLIAQDAFDFGNYMYDGGNLNDSDATVRGLQFAQQQEWSPEQTVQEWNSALGTEFTLDDLNAALELHNMQSGGGGKLSVYDTEFGS